MSTIKPLVAGNWKMNGMRAALPELKAIDAGYAEAMRDRVDLAVCPPATLLSEAVASVTSGHIRIGGQDCHANENGAHTGDVSAWMIRDCGADCVIVGHSERRADHGESSTAVHAKALAAHAAGLTAIICVGESEAERDAGNTLDVVADQVAASVPDAAEPSGTIIAYEPVWAIGTGRTPTTDDVAEVHAMIRDRLESRFGTDGSAIRILYGGSVKPANAAELMGVSNVNGALVGGASLKATDFLGIAAAYLS
ncbi:MAG: triose-phosphate isomerase [Pseudomonadota bacterium]